MPYGDWDEWRRRDEEARDEGRTRLAGVQCRECLDQLEACIECQRLMDAFAILHWGNAGYYVKATAWVDAVSGK